MAAPAITVAPLRLTSVTARGFCSSLRARDAAST
jgi:hypothetical protein